MKHIFRFVIFWLCLSGILLSCKKESTITNLKNDVIKKTVSPLVVGEKIEFAYAIGSLNGKLNSAQVIASIPGAAGTGFEPFSWRTVNAVNISSAVARDCITKNEVSSAVFIDTNASTLRYFYVVPEEARGKEISFQFSCDNQSGDHANFKLPSYKVAQMTMKKNITMVATATGARYFSIEDMKAYTLAEVQSSNLSAKIDFVYAYSPTIAVGTQSYTYAHAFVSANEANYFPSGFTIPGTWTKNSTSMEKKLNVWDGQLAGSTNMDIFVDDLDLQKTDIYQFIGLSARRKSERKRFHENCRWKIHRLYIYKQCYKCYKYRSDRNQTTHQSIRNEKSLIDTVPLDSPSFYLNSLLFCFGLMDIFVRIPEKANWNVG